MAHDLGRPGKVGAGGQVVQLPHQSRQGGQRGVRQGPVRYRGLPGDDAFQESQRLVPVVVDS